MDWFYLALLAPLLYAIVNLLDDNLLQFVYKSSYVAAVSAGFYGALPLISRLFIHADSIPAGLAVLSIIAGFLTLCYYFFYFKGLEADAPSVVVALFGLATALLPIFAHFILHEQLQGLQLVGFVIVLLASLSLGVNSFRGFKFSKALLPILAGIVFMDAAALLTKNVYEQVPFYPAYLYFSAGMGLGAIFFLLLKWADNKKAIRQISRNIKRLLPIFIVAELTGLAAEFTLNLAISRGPVSLVKVIEETQPVYVLLIALALYPRWPRFFREAEEGRPLRKFVLMTVVIIGLGIVAVSGA